MLARFFPDSSRRLIPEHESYSNSAIRTRAAQPPSVGSQEAVLMSIQRIAGITKNPYPSSCCTPPIGSR